MGPERSGFYFSISSLQLLLLAPVPAASQSRLSGSTLRVTLLFLWKPSASFVMSLLKSVALGLKLALDKEVVGSLPSKPKGCQGRDGQTNVNCQCTCLNKDSRLSPKGCWEKSWTIHILLWLLKPKFRARRQGEPVQLLLAWEKATQERSIHLKPFLNQKGVKANWSVHRGHSVNQAGGACSLSSTIMAYLAKLSQDRPSDVVWATPLSSRKWNSVKHPDSFLRSRTDGIKNPQDKLSQTDLWEFLVKDTFFLVNHNTCDSGCIWYFGLRSSLVLFQRLWSVWINPKSEVQLMLHF